MWHELAERLREHHPALDLHVGSNDPAGFDLVVNATPMGMNAGDAMPMDVSRIETRTFVGEVMMKTEMTAFLGAAKARGCAVQIGSDMLFEQIPAYLEFFGLPSTTPDELRAIAMLDTPDPFRAIGAQAPRVPSLLQILRSAETCWIAAVERHNLAWTNSSSLNRLYRWSHAAA